MKNRFPYIPPWHTFRLSRPCRIGGTVTVLCPAELPTTERALRVIAAQGLMGRITTKNVGYVAAKTIDHALKGHSVYIPGTVNRFLKFLGA